MDKKIKELIKEKGLSDDDLIKIISSYNDDEDDESENSVDSEEQNDAEEDSAEKEKPKTKSDISMDTIQKLITDAVADALKPKGNTKKIEPITAQHKKKEPKSETKDTSYKLGEFNLLEG